MLSITVVSTLILHAFCFCLFLFLRGVFAWKSFLLSLTFSHFFSILPSVRYNGCCWSFPLQSQCCPILNFSAFKADVSPMLVNAILLATLIFNFTVSWKEGLLPIQNLSVMMISSKNYWSVVLVFTRFFSNQSFLLPNGKRVPGTIANITQRKGLLTFISLSVKRAYHR